MAKISDDVKAFIVTRLACYEPPSRVAAAVKLEFGIDMPRQHVQLYDPEKGQKPAKRWCVLFEATRAKLLAGVDATPGAHIGVRVATLWRLCERAEASGNIPLAAALLEQIAKETGGLYTNRRELTGKGGGPIAHKDVGPDLDDLSDAQLAELASKLVAEVSP
jgi:hypothetical protein